MKTVYSSRFTVNGKSTIGALRHPSETLPTSRQRGTKRGKVLMTTIENQGYVCPEICSPDELLGE
jgi:hypothetical protein